MKTPTARTGEPDESTPRDDRPDAAPPGNPDAGAKGEMRRMGPIAQARAAARAAAEGGVVTPLGPQAQARRAAAQAQAQAARGPVPPVARKAPEQPQAQHAARGPVPPAAKKAPEQPEPQAPAEPRLVMPEMNLGTVRAASFQRRHVVLMTLFLLLVVLPPVAWATYLYAVAVDQYESDIGFGSRTQEATRTFDILGVLGGAGSAATKDMDILNHFVVSQELVERIDAKLDLRKIYARHPEDWYFSFPPDGPIEDLVEYWQKMVVVNYDSSTGLMALRVFAFSPEDSQAIAREIVAESSAIINELSKTSLEDTTRYSREALAKAEDRYRNAQSSLTEFRIKNRIVDPQMQLQGASQVINGLVQQLAEAQINLDLLKGQVADNDPRIGQLNRRIDVIQKRIAEETGKVGASSDSAGPGYANLVRDYQNLQTEMEFAQKSYLASQGAYDQAVAEASQQTHYLATYLSPTLAQSSTAPDRPLRIFLVFLAGLMSWATMSMVYYALRDRR